MKQTNKLLNILNILSVIFIILSLNEWQYIDYEYFVFVMIINCSILNLTNLVVGIINLKMHNKKIGIVSIVMMLISLCLLIVILISEDFINANISEWLTYLVLFFNIIVFPILAIINLIQNKKLENIKKKTYKTSLFWCIILTWITILIIPMIVIKMDLINISKAVDVLIKQKLQDDKVLISFRENFCEFFDREGNIIDQKNYNLVYSYDFKPSLEIIIVNENGENWLIDYKGNKLQRIYALFGTINYFELIEKIPIDYKGLRDYKYNFLPIQSGQDVIKDNILIFGNRYLYGYEIKVEIFKEEVENDTSYVNDVLEALKEEPVVDLQKLYKYKKNYYLINKDGSEIELNCNNLIFTYDEYGYGLSVQVYSNKYIPYYDNDSTGFFNLNGERIAFNKRFLVYDTLDTYQIIFDLIRERFYYKSDENNDLMEIEGENFKFCNNDFIITEDGIYKIYNNKIDKISRDKSERYEYLKYIIININNEQIDDNRDLPYYNLIYKY